MADEIILIVVLPDCSIMWEVLPPVCALGAEGRLRQNTHGLMISNPPQMFPCLASRYGHRPINHQVRSRDE